MSSTIPPGSLLSGGRRCAASGGRFRVIGLALVKSAFRKRSFLGTGAGFSLLSLCILSAIAVTGLTVPSSAPPLPDQTISVTEPRVVVIKSQRVLHLFNGKTLVRSYAIDLGTAPTGDKRRRGDGRTPLGAFSVVTKNVDSPYHRFLGIDYPNQAAVERGLAHGLVSFGEAGAILDALASGGCPDWSTSLGGGIGIHGRRRGSDWTAGCIAVDDEDVEELFDVLRIGDRVEILP